MRTDEEPQISVGRLLLLYRLQSRPSSYVHESRHDLAVERHRQRDALGELRQAQLDRLY
ncbi:hypothetical protein ACFRFU_46735 [Streptomyces sp. NPDC056704]|uniref:hypothetical protein n=1 Tax=Streptomyces sp. NPDC056704 TaxID=3345917 RepID=UPI0036A7E784